MSVFYIARGFTGKIVTWRTLGGTPILSRSLHIVCGLDAKHPYLGKVKIVIEHSLLSSADDPGALDYSHLYLKKIAHGYRKGARILRRYIYSMVIKPVCYPAERAKQVSHASHQCSARIGCCQALYIACARFAVQHRRRAGKAVSPSQVIAARQISA